MGVGPKSPVEVDFRAGSNLSMERSRLRANDATLGVTTALEIGRSYILDRAVALDLTGDALRGGAGVRVLVRLGKLKKKRMNAMLRYWMTWRAEVDCARLSTL